MPAGSQEAVLARNVEGVSRIAGNVTLHPQAAGICLKPEPESMHSKPDIITCSWFRSTFTPYGQHEILMPLRCRHGQRDGSHQRPWRVKVRACCGSCAICALSLNCTSRRPAWPAMRVPAVRLPQAWQFLFGGCRAMRLTATELLAPQVRRHHVGHTDAAAGAAGGAGAPPLLVAPPPRRLPQGGRLRRRCARPQPGARRVGRTPGATGSFRTICYTLFWLCSFRRFWPAATGWALRRRGARPQPGACRTGCPAGPQGTTFECGVVRHV